LTECENNGKKVDILDLFRFKKNAESERVAKKDPKNVKIFKIG
jgi:hypothetical protein